MQEYVKERHFPLYIAVICGYTSEQVFIKRRFCFRCEVSSTHPHTKHHYYWHSHPHPHKTITSEMNTVFKTHTYAHTHKTSLHLTCRKTVSKPAQQDAPPGTSRVPYLRNLETVVERTLHPCSGAVRYLALHIKRDIKSVVSLCK